MKIIAWIYCKKDILSENYLIELENDRYFVLKKIIRYTNICVSRDNELPYVTPQSSNYYNNYIRSEHDMQNSISFINCTTYDVIFRFYIIWIFSDNLLEWNNNIY